MARTPGSHARLTAPRIEAAALELIARDGFAAVSMRQVAAAVGVQVGALYNYVPDKHTMLVRLIDGVLDDADAAWAEVPETGDAADRLDAAVTAHLRFALARGEAAHLPERELGALAPEARAVARARLDRRRAALEEILKDGREQEMFRLPDTGLLITAILSALDGVAAWAPGSGLTDDRVERMCLNIVRRIVPRVGK